MLEASDEIDLKPSSRACSRGRNFISMSNVFLLFTTLEIKARNLELRANALGTRDMLIRWRMCPKRSQ